MSGMSGRFNDMVMSFEFTSLEWQSNAIYRITCRPETDQFVQIGFVSLARSWQMSIRRNSLARLAGLLSERGWARADSDVPRLQEGF